MAFEMQRLGARALNHSSDATEAEYDRLRDLARDEAAKRASCLDRSQQAYQSGDGARAKQLSEQGKEHARKMDEYNRQAANFIFRANNAVGRVHEDEIDLHGLYVNEAEDILETRIKSAQSQGQQYLHVIVGRGNHSRDHVQKIKPRVEQVCRELGLQYQSEENEGRILVNLQGGPAHQAPHHGGGNQHHGGQQHHGGHHQPQQNNNDVAEELVKKGLSRLFKSCCIVM